MYRTIFNKDFPENFSFKTVVKSKNVTIFATQKKKEAFLILLTGAVVQLVRIHACHAWGRGFESRPHRLRKKTEIRKSKTISSKSVTLGIFFCYTTTDEYPVGSRKLDKSSNQIVTKKKNGNFGYDFVDMSLICRRLRSILSTRRNLKS